jgi:phosphatidylserine decarboxylase
MPIECTFPHSKGTCVSDRLAVLPQYLMPKQAMTRLAGALASRPLGAITRSTIARFIRRYNVRMDEALQSDPTQYATFNDFFTRALKPGARPLAPDGWVSPVDGAISQLGPIERGQIFQAKGHHYTATALVGGDAALAAPYEQGLFATLYLSPRDYHRIHMPWAGRLKRMIHVPGDLFSVNPTTARGVPGLFARNERVVCVFEGQHQGRTFDFVMVLVGATIVGSMATVWHGVVNPPRPGTVRQWDYTDRQMLLARGEEMGRFLLGSTVVLLLPPGVAQFVPDWQAGRAIVMGEAMAKAL